MHHYISEDVFLTLLNTINILTYSEYTVKINFCWTFFFYSDGSPLFTLQPKPKNATAILD